MPISVLNKFRFEQEFKATPGPDGTIRIGRNEACSKLKRVEDKYRPALVKYESDMVAINADRNLSEAGKQAKRAERIAAFKAEQEQLRTDATTHAQALGNETEALRATTRGLFAPKDAGDKVEASEYRNVLRGMNHEQRIAAIRKAVDAGDRTMLMALANVPAWDTSILGPEGGMRTIVANAIHNLEVEAMDPAERIAVENAATFSQIALGKLQAFDDEAKRITEGRQS